MSCPTNVYPAFPCSGAIHAYMDEEENSSEIYVHRGIIQEKHNPPEVVTFDSDRAVYDFLRTLRFVKYVEADTGNRCYVVWVHEDTHLVAKNEDDTSRKTSVFAIGFRPTTCYSEPVEFEVGAHSTGWVGHNIRNTDPVPNQHIRQLITNEVFSNHSAVSSIREATYAFYAQEAGPSAMDEYYYPTSVRFVFRTYIINF